MADMPGLSPATTPDVTTQDDFPRGYPSFANDGGAEIIKIGVKEFECMGARAPHDHPHVYLDMGSDTEIICPYCSTLYRYDGSLGRLQSDPADAYVGDSQRAPVMNSPIGPKTPGAY